MKVGQNLGIFPIPGDHLKGPRMITRVEPLPSGEFIITCVSDVIGPDGEQEIDGYWDGSRWNGLESNALRFTDVDVAEEIAESLVRWCEAYE